MLWTNLQDFVIIDYSFINQHNNITFISYVRNKKIIYIPCSILIWENTEVMDYSRLIKKAAINLNLSKTDIEILKNFVEGKKLLVSDITDHIKRSERHVRQRLSMLVEKGFLKKTLKY